MRSTENITDEDILKQLKNQGFSEEISKMALKNCKSKDIESILEYIEDIQNMEEERRRRQNASVKNEAANQIARAQLEENARKTREQMLKDKLYVQNLKAKIEADRREMQSNVENTAETTTKCSEYEGGDSPCKINVRFETGYTRIFGFNTGDTLENLFARIGIEMSGTVFRVFRTGTSEEIFNDGRTLEETGLSPRGSVMVSKD
ncbi:hypothetical protein CWI38_1806p0010 [Hamiltosporidium tvaerminnensis]|uniref:UBA domain-containing protein n=2 Tax=Hamiltosporidium TaxID=1176354 RepID=A0A4Q9L4U0_9MICR|nr:hypothetical protein LUQ84_001661 [Hamiltosporidium tvaerminnensis]TBT99126.1 hypothetical protein CWI37_1456p0010 [Hamiltosporidium tvaerminnensis]TBU01344.1 hypothetical protein CWI36_1365p0010 [Hamiltosporidium magnivora]TBU01590.1 hypothetical protein CWI39_1350p0010 [Hamiltosporidium magnivora]TBU10379.1 hypothetical protein CWI38_1806p0010 [Hamiltosporidium tvaerminnensis]